jgi:hypothetical protein
MRLSLPVPGGTKMGGVEPVSSGVVLSPFSKGAWSTESSPIKDVKPKYLIKLIT